MASSRGSRVGRTTDWWRRAAGLGLVGLVVCVLSPPVWGRDGVAPTVRVAWRAAAAGSATTSVKKSAAITPARPLAERARPDEQTSVQAGADRQPARELRWRPREIETFHWTPVSKPLAARTPAGKSVVHASHEEDPFGPGGSGQQSSPAGDPGSAAEILERVAQLDDPLKLPNAVDMQPAPGGVEDDGNEIAPAEETADTAAQPEAAPSVLGVPGSDERPNELPAPFPLDSGGPDHVETRQAPAAECRTALQKLHENRLSSIGLDIEVRGEAGDDFPVECDFGAEAFTPRAWPETLFTWKASALCHKPLYFEEEAVERYGHSKGPFVQPLYSGARFFATLPILPYKMGLTPPTECVYALGHYRPGSCAPYLIPPIPLSARGALFQAGAVVGAAAIVP